MYYARAQVELNSNYQPVILSIAVYATPAADWGSLIDPSRWSIDIASAPTSADLYEKIGGWPSSMRNLLDEATKESMAMKALSNPVIKQIAMMNLFSFVPPAHEDQPPTWVPEYGNKIRAIKAVRTRTGLGLKFCKDFVEEIIKDLCAAGLAPKTWDTTI